MAIIALKKIDIKQDWEQLVSSFSEANFLQSWNWGEFHTALGKKVFRLAFYQQNSAASKHDHPQSLVAVAECVIETAKRGTYLTIAGGPLITMPSSKSQATTLISTIFEHIQTIASQEKCLFIRMRPQLVVEENTELNEIFHQVGFVESPMHLTADLTQQLDLTKSIDQILSEMRKNTRYEVRQVEKKGVTVTTSQDPDEIKEFYQHQLALAQKHDFVPFSYEFLYQQFVSFARDDQVLLFHSWKDATLLASAFIIFYNHEAVYHYGISTPDNSKLPGSYACQWAAIQEAQKRGCTRYNFWGIAPKDQTDHRFAGVSIFKRGWGGREVQYFPAHDLPLNWQYQLTRGFELVRKKARKL